jgi:hypothetical protein
MTPKKKKRDLLATFERIQRFHQRRTVLIVHATLSLAFQAALWTNWYASYAVQGRGFEGSFFSDRFTIALVLLIILAGHGLLTRLLESQDRMVLAALRQHEDAIESAEEWVDDEDEDDTEDEIAARRLEDDLAAPDSHRMGRTR